jgi:hypothetical protein
MVDKESFVKGFFPDTVKDLKLVHIDLDSSYLTVPDIMRNVNRSFPANSKDRNKIISGEKVIVIWCTSQYLAMIKGLLLIFCGDEMNIEGIKSENYILVSVGISKLTDDELIDESVNRIAVYMTKELGNDIKMDEFYVKCLYDNE